MLGVLYRRVELIVLHRHDAIEDVGTCVTQNKIATLIEW